MLEPQRILRGLVPIAVALLGLSAPVRATCGSSYCFLDSGGREAAPRKGVFRVDFSYQFIHQGKKLSGTERVDEVLTPEINFAERSIEPDAHREEKTDNTLLDLALSYGLTDRLELSVVLPLVTDRDHDHFHRLETAPAEGELPEYEFLRDDGSSGFGDVRIGLRSGFVLTPRDLLVGGLFIKIPTGSYTGLNQHGEINEPSIQPGTGSWDFIGRMRWSHQVVTQQSEWFASATYRLNTENDLDYEFADETVLTVGFQRGMGPNWYGSLQVNERHAGRDRYVGQPVPSTGSNLVHLTPGLRFRSDKGTDFYLHVQLPVYQRVRESQLAPQAGILVGVSRTF